MKLLLVNVAAFLLVMLAIYNGKSLYHAHVLDSAAQDVQQQLNNVMTTIQKTDQRQVQVNAILAWLAYLESLTSVEPLVTNWTDRTTFYKTLRVELAHYANRCPTAVNGGGAFENINTLDAKQCNPARSSNYDTLLTGGLALISFLQREHQLRPLIYLNPVAVLVLAAGCLWMYQQRMASSLKKRDEALNELVDNKKRLMRSQSAMAVIMDDIRIERLRSEAFDAENQILADMVMQSDQPILRLSTKGVVEMHNDAAGRLLGLSESQSQNNILFETLFSARDAVPISAAIKKVLLMHVPVVIHARKENGLGRDSVIMELTFLPLHRREAHEASVSVFVRDESMYHQEQTQLKNIIEQAPTALMVVTEQGEIVSVNAEMELTFNYSRSELVGQSIEVLVPESLREGHKWHRQSFLNDRSGARRMGGGRAFQGLTKEGNLIFIEVGLSVFHSADSKLLIVSVIDVSEREYAERELQGVNKKLTLKNKEMEQFIYTVSHDLKSPLVSISAFSQALRQELDGTLTERQAHRLNRIIFNVLYMESLLSDLLALSQVIRQDVEKTEVSIQQIIESIKPVLEKELEEKNGRLVCESQLPVVYGNEKLIRHTMQNLLSNAIKYSRENVPPMIEIESVDDETEHVIAVKDNGIGIHENHQKKVFDIFERLGVGSGTGVGLAIVQSAMDKHGGSVSLTSKEGEGSCFTLRFPKRKPEEVKNALS